MLLKLTRFFFHLCQVKVFCYYLNNVSLTQVNYVESQPQIRES